jgi:PQQ-dependent dehydrogenase (methanol/ethanol family)
MTKTISAHALPNWARSVRAFIPSSSSAQWTIPVGEEGAVGIERSWRSLLAVWTALAVSGALLVGCIGGAKADDGAPPEDEWAYVDGTPLGWHFGGQTQINDETVSRLGLAWAADMPSAEGLVGTPLVKEGTVYQSGAGGIVYANDARTGAQKWIFTPEQRTDAPTEVVALWAMRHNRGLAIDDAHVYVAAGDCRLFALNRATGKQDWVTEACDPKANYGITSAPRLGGGMVFMGNANADFNTSRGFVSAFDAKTGKELWRFYLRPGNPAEPFESEEMKKAAATWGKDYWPSSVGGAHAWDGMTYDPELGLLYIGTNGPLPENPALRGKDAGDELFSSAIVAIDAKTGKYVWHYTQVPHDGWDQSAVAPIQIVELPIDGVKRRVLMQAPKNGFFYLLDAKTGKFISAGQIAAQNWAKGIDAKGRPIPNPEAQYWNRPNQETVVSPGPNGARSWEAMAYSPMTSLVYVPTRTIATLYRPGQDSDWYYSFRDNAAFQAQGQLTAWDPVRQRKVWQVIRPSTHNGGVMATAGNLVFQGTLEGTFDAFDAKTGKLLWSFTGDGSIMSAPTTAVIDGVQYIFVASGDNGGSAVTHSNGGLSSSPDKAGPPRLLAFRLDGTAKPTSREGYGPIVLPKPWRPRQGASLVAQGSQIFSANACGFCHGMDAIQGGRTIPDLRASTPETYAAMREILNGAYQAGGMPAFKHVTDQEIVALQAYMTERAWIGYEKQQGRGHK